MTERSVQRLRDRTGKDGNLTAGAALALVLAAGLAPAMAAGEEADGGTGPGVTIERGEGDSGVMSMDVATDHARVDALRELIAGSDGEIDLLVFEPYQLRHDLGDPGFVYLMRHGPTDWSKRDAQGVAPDDWANQRVMTEEGRETMAVMGAMMAGSQMRPERIVVSQWCRNQQTLGALMRGIRLIDPDYADAIKIEDFAEANLLLSLGGAPDVEALRRTIADWSGEDGPLLIISHYTNIEELTTFRVYEGEALILHPERDSRVRGFFRMQSAAPDPGHFPDASEG